MASKKKCMVFETLGRVDTMKITESANDGAVRMHGVFGVCGVKNGNNRIYSKENYGKMVENLQKVIANEGCLGELEHPNTMNINLDNVSHKIESIEMDSNGTITGTIRLLDTAKGKNAKAIVEAGCPLFISSRGAGSIDENGNVTLSTIKTYDLVGTPGFSQAKLTLKKNQTCESLNENLTLIIEGEDEEPEEEPKKDDKSSEKNEEEPKDKDPKKDEEPEEEPKEDDNKDNKDNDNKVTMEDIKVALDKLSEKVTSLEAELHVAQESIVPVKYEAIEKWATEELLPEITDTIKEAVIDEVDERIKDSTTNIANGVQKWISEEYTPKVEKWINEEYSTKIEEWVSEEYSPAVQKWISEEYSPTIEKWISEEYSTTIEKWINEEYSTTIEKWINEEYSASIEKWINEEYSATLQNWISEEYTAKVGEWINEEYSQTLQNWISGELMPEQLETINEYLESKKDDRLMQIDKMLESIDAMGGTSAVDKLVKENKEATKFAGVYVVENMPSQYAPLWNGLSESRQNEILRTSRMYNFTKPGVLESFWANVDFTDNTPVSENKITESKQPNYADTVAARMRALRGI